MINLLTFRIWLEKENDYKKINAQIKELENEREELYKKSRELEKEILSDLGMPQAGTIFVKVDGENYQINQYGIYPMTVIEVKE